MESLPQPASPVRKAVRAKAKARPDGQPRKSELTRARLLDAAAFVFRQKGYALTRLADIAVRARTPTSGIYYYFKSREAIVAEVLRIANERTLERVQGAVAALPPEATIQDKITAAVHGHLGIVLSGDPYTLAHMRIFDQIPAKLQKRFLGVLDETSEIWRQLFAEAHEAGVLRDDLDLSVVRHLLLGMMNWSIEWYKPGRLSIEEIARQTASLLFSGIGAPQPVVAARPARAARTARRTA